MRHVITGGSGFTGRYLANFLLRRGDDVVLFDRRPPSFDHTAVFIQGDATVAGDLDRIGLRPGDVVYHLAARQFADAVPRVNRTAWFEAVNVAGTREVLAAMARGGANKLVFFSTDMTYGVPQSTPVAPSHPQRPIGPYGTSKMRAEALIRAARKEGIAATIFRPRLITGPGRLGILERLFRLIRAGLPVPLIGRGANRYQMVSVEDCVTAAARAVDRGCPPGPFNLGSASPPTTRMLLEAVIQHANSRSVLIPVSAAPLKATLAALDFAGLTLMYPEQFGIADLDILLDTSATRSELGWEPSIDDVAAMTAAYDAFVANAPSRRTPTG
jgi:nucleoside-diphosphate-sugar epimerase